jgi:phage tail-like protein
MPKSRTDDAISPARFSLTVDGIEIAQFSELIAITSEAEPDDLVGAVLKKLPGKRTPPTVTLRRPLSTDTQMWAWHDAAMEPRTKEAHRDAALVMYDTAGEPVARYHLEKAWVPKIEIGAVRAGTSAVLTETVTIACERAQRLAT